MSIAQNILEIIRDQLFQLELDNARVKVVRMRIGEMAGVVPESLRFCFEVASEGTPAQGAQLTIEEIPIKCRCCQCGSDFSVESYAFICPKCGNADVELLSGNELQVVELELDE